MSSKETEEDHMQTIKVKQEQVIKSLVLTHALFEQDNKEFNPEEGAAVKEEFI